MDMHRMHGPLAGYDLAHRRASMQRFETLYARVSMAAGVAGAIALLTLLCRTSHLLG